MEDDNKDDEVITLRLPRKDAQMLRDIIEDRRAYTRVTNALKNTWIWIVVAGFVTTISFWESIKLFFIGTVK